MRRLMFNGVSVDGYFADRDGMLDWVVQDEIFDVERRRR
jgi:hypothetical protein